MKLQKSLSCYIIPTLIIMRTLIKIQIFSPPHLLTDHRKRGNLLVCYCTQPLNWMVWLEAAVRRCGGESVGGLAQWMACLVMVSEISGDLGSCLIRGICAVLHEYACSWWTLTKSLSLVWSVSSDLPLQRLLSLPLSLLVLPLFHISRQGSTLYTQFMKQFFKSSSNNSASHMQ